MKIQITALRDRATDQYSNPMPTVALGKAIREFTDEINRADEKNELYKHPDDFDLYHLGEYDSETGKFKTEDPKQIAIGKNVAIRN